MKNLIDLLVLGLAEDHLSVMQCTTSYPTSPKMLALVG